MSYKSQYTGAEVDLAVSKLLGDDYDNSASPGCKLIGINQDLPQDLNQVTIPGMYTIFFYFNGPENDTEHVDFRSKMPSPIRMRVYWEGSKEIQWILYDTDVYYRDIQVTTKWTKVELAAKAIKIIDNLFSDEKESALSANMGRFLKEYIDGRQIGGQNLLTNSSFTVSYYDNNTGWIWSSDVDGSGVIADNDSATWIHSMTKPVIRQVAITNNHTTGAISFMTDPDVMPHVYAGTCSYTASIYLSKALGMTKVDPQTGKKYLEISLQIAVTNDFGSQYLAQSQPTVIRINESDVIDSSGNIAHIRITNTFANPGNIAGKIMFIISLITPGKVYAYAPKLEFGDYATEWNQSMPEQYEDYCNAKKFYGTQIEQASQTNPLKQQTGYRYDTTKDKFVLDQLAVGGGGGFISGTTAPTEKQCLWFDKSTYDGYLRYHNGTNWVQIPIASIIAGTTSPTDTSKWWLDTTTEDNVIAASLKYYDAARKIWRMPLTSPAKCFTIQATAPENKSLIWIHSDTHIPRVYDDTTSQWIIMHAAWGENRNS